MTHVQGVYYYYSVLTYRVTTTTTTFSLAQLAYLSAVTTG